MIPQSRLSQTAYIIGKVRKELEQVALPMAVRVNSLDFYGSRSHLVKPFR
jgi:hypothetical protein